MNYYKLEEMYHDLYGMIEQAQWFWVIALLTSLMIVGWYVIHLSTQCKHENTFQTKKRVPFIEADWVKLDVCYDCGHIWKRDIIEEEKQQRRLRQSMLNAYKTLWL